MWGRWWPLFNLAMFSVAKTQMWFSWLPEPGYHQVSIRNKCIKWLFHCGNRNQCHKHEELHTATNSELLFWFLGDQGLSSCSNPYSRALLSRCFGWERHMWIQPSTVQASTYEKIIWIPLTIDGETGTVVCFSLFTCLKKLRQVVPKKCLCGSADSRV